ncbi:unnamed protein product [Lactuca saligna]|uniref:Uncharacterized protein n=1 Tax=Lactuca saligna TaxID=75948 RepID=A0AA35Y363_LACSI|nr:unnamed protein product [Lactuca saligna]
MADRSKFDFIGSIPEARLCDIPTSSKILKIHCTLTPSGPRPLTNEFQAILAEADKPKKGGKGSKKPVKTDSTKEGPSAATKPPSHKQKAPNTSTTAPKRNSETESEIRIEEDPPVHNEDDEPICTEEQEQVRTEREVTPSINDFVPFPPPSPKTTTSVPITISPLPIVSSQPPITISVSIPIFTDSTIPPQPSFAPECSVNVSDMGANTSGILERVAKDHIANISSVSKAIFNSVAICKETNEKVDKLITNTRVFIYEYQVTYNNNTSITNKPIQNVGAMFKAEKETFFELHTEFKCDHEAFQASVDVRLTKL